jgi:hypothetical protein
VNNHYGKYCHKNSDNYIIDQLSIVSVKFCGFGVGFVKRNTNDKRRMKKLSLVLKTAQRFYRASMELTCISFLFLHASHAYGAWELITKSPRGDPYYLDSTITKKGMISQVWGLVDLSKPIESSESVKRLYEVDCVKGKIRVSQRWAYASKGGQGAVVSHDKAPGQWIYPDPESINEELLLKVCFEKKKDVNKP